MNWVDASWTNALVAVMLTVTFVIVISPPIFPKIIRVLRRRNRTKSSNPPVVPGPDDVSFGGPRVPRLDEPRKSPPTPTGGLSTEADKEKGET